MRVVLFYIFLATVFFSCDVPYELDLGQTPDQYVIEALVTDNPKFQSVKISKSANFYSTGNTPRVTDAVVTVSDDAGNTINFIHNPNSHADSAGIYIPESSFAGVIGRTYNLKVQIQGTTFEATDKLASVIPMDSLAYEVNKEEQEDPEEEGYFYEVLMFAREPQDVENYYLFKFFRNDTLTFLNDTDIYFSDDELLAENIDGAPSPIFYKQNDTARIEVYSISRVAYVYYSDLWALLNNDSGGMFGPIPSSPRTNLTNGALGFFQVSAVNISRIKIE
jgi:hypothetical protein